MIQRCEKCKKMFYKYFENNKNKLCPKCWLDSFKIEYKKEVNKNV
jgi:Zn finger protein HypA/HybF involved in hydrogenase expression